MLFLSLADFAVNLKRCVVGQVLVHSCKFSSSLPWHHDRVWFHDKAQLCAALPPSCREVMLVFKCGSKLAATSAMEVSESTDQVTGPIGRERVLSARRGWTGGKEVAGRQ